MEAWWYANEWIHLSAIYVKLEVKLFILFPEL
jgi:hypothetical protein